MWGEGRLKVEPWLEKRVMKPNTRIHANSKLEHCVERPTARWIFVLITGESFVVDDVILATGYKVELNRLPFLKSGNVFDKIEVKNGFPVLDPYFQSSVKGLYFTSLPAGQDFGPFFGFTVSVRASAKIIGNALKQ
jgi:FAD-dependent urate hydroxylase